MPSVVVGPTDSLQDAIDAASPGDTIEVIDGEYDFVEFGTGDGGSVGSPVTLKSATKWGARIVPASGHHGIYIADGCDYVVIDGMHVSGVSGDYDGIKTNADNTTIKNNWVHDCTQNGIGAFGAASAVIESNKVEDCGSDGFDHGIYCDSSGCVIRNNIARRCTGFGIHQYVLAGTQNASIYQNISYNNGSSGILIRGVGAGTACGHVVNNNIIGVASTDADAPIRIDDCNGAVVANNIIFPGTGMVVDERDATTGTVWTNNIVYQLIDNQNTHGAVNTNEILQNTGFETDGIGGQPFANWTKSESGSSTVTSDTTNQDTGSKCCKLHVDSGSSCAVYQSATMVVGGVYTLEFRAKASAVVGVQLNPPTVQCSLTTAYKTFRITFVATAAYLYLQRATGSGTYDIYIDNVSLKRAYGPSLHGAPQGLFFPRLGSSAIDAGSNTYKPATDFWGETPPTDVQIGAFPYTEHLHPRTMLNDPWNITKVNRRWWNWRRREQTLKPA